MTIVLEIHKAGVHYVWAFSRGMCYISGIILIFNCQELESLTKIQDEVRNFAYLFMYYFL